MKEISHKNIKTILNEKPSHTLLVSCPNYEPRSAMSTSLQMLEDSSWSGNLLIFQVISSGRSIEPLEWLNRIAMDEFETARMRNLVNINIVKIGYPYQAIRIHQDLESAIRRLRRPYRIILNITSMPRFVIAHCMDFFKKKAFEVEKLFIIYTWATGYPLVTHPTASGDILGVRQSTNLHKLLENAHKPAVLIFPGLQGFDAQKVSDAFKDRGERIKVAIYFSGDDPLLSLDAIRANVNLLDDQKTEVQYYFSIEQAYDLIKSWATARIQDGNDALFIAPFGPKPLLAWAWLQLSQFVPTWDILLVKEANILTTYSTGHGRTSLFEISRDDLMQPTSTTL